jgi:hypothetical protein
MWLTQRGVPQCQRHHNQRSSVLPLSSSSTLPSICHGILLFFYVNSVISLVSADDETTTTGVNGTIIIHESESCETTAAVGSATFYGYIFATLACIILVRSWLIPSIYLHPSLQCICAILIDDLYLVCHRLVS